MNRASGMMRAGLIMGTLILCLVLLEFGLRSIGRQPTNMADGIDIQNGDSYKIKPNAHKTLNFPAFSYTVFTNEYGFRDSAVGPRQLETDSFSVFLGASDVFGNGLDYENTFVGIFAGEAAKKGISVLNLAVGGHHMPDQEALLKGFMETTGLKPSTIFFGLNALVIPKFDRSNQNIIVKNGYAIDRPGWRLTYLRLMAGNISSAFCFFRDSIRRIQERYMNYEVTEKSPEFLQIYSIHNSIRQPGRLEQFEEHLTAFESFCRRNALRLVYVYLPLSDSFRVKEMAERLGLSPDDFDPGFYEEVLQAHCERRGLALVNPRPDLERAYAEGLELRFKLDPHFNKFANRIIGERLIKNVLSTLKQ